MKRHKSAPDTIRYDSCDLKYVNYAGSGWVDGNAVYEKSSHALRCPGQEATGTNVVGEGIATHTRWPLNNDERIAVIRQSSDTASADLAKKATEICVTCPYYGISKNDIVTHRQKRFIDQSVMFHLSYLTESILDSKSM